MLFIVLKCETSIRVVCSFCQVLPTIPKDQRNRVAHFLEKQGFKPQALAVTCDPEHKFELALQLGDLKTAYSIALEQDVSSVHVIM